MASNSDKLDGYHVGIQGSAIPRLDVTNTWSADQNFNAKQLILLYSGTTLSSLQGFLTGGGAVQSTTLSARDNLNLLTSSAGGKITITAPYQIYLASPNVVFDGGLTLDGGNLWVNLDGTEVFKVTDTIFPFTHFKVDTTNAIVYTDDLLPSDVPAYTPISIGETSFGIVSPYYNLNLNGKAYFQTGNSKQSSITYYGSNMIINPKEVGTGKLLLGGDINMQYNNLMNINDISNTRNITPQTTAVSSIGTSSLRYHKGWFNNLDATNINVTNLNITGNEIISGTSTLKQTLDVTGESIFRGANNYFLGNLSIYTADPNYVNFAVCYLTGGNLGHCVSAVNSTGGCNCANN